MTKISWWRLSIKVLIHDRCDLKKYFSIDDKLDIVNTTFKQIGKAAHLIQYI